MSELTETELQVRIMHQNMELFRDAMLRAFQAVPVTEQDHIQQFISTLFYKYKPYSLLQPTVIASLSADIFQDSRNREFIWQLIFHFFSVIGNQGERIGSLIENLISGLLINQPAVQYKGPTDKDADNTPEGGSALPAELADRIEIDYDPYEALSSNKWLIVIALFHLCYHFADIENLLEQLKEPPARSRLPSSQSTGA